MWKLGIPRTSRREQFLIGVDQLNSFTSRSQAFQRSTLVQVIRIVHAACMHVGLRHFDSQTLDWLAGRLRSGEATRHGLARELCERTGWRNSLGDPCLSAAAKALPALSERIGIDLPAPRSVPDPAAAPAVPAEDVPDTRLACPLGDLGPVSLVPVDGDDDRRLWEAMMAAHHPLGWARPPGGQVRCWIRSERHGTLGGIGFGSATWQLRDRGGRPLPLARDRHPDCRSSRRNEKRDRHECPFNAGVDQTPRFTEQFRPASVIRKDRQTGMENKPSPHDRTLT